MNEEELGTKAIALKHDVEGLVVVDRPSFDAGEALRATIKKAIKETKDFFAPQKQEAQSRHKKICDLEKRTLQPFVACESELKNKLYAYTEEQRRIAEEAAHMAQEAARKKAEEERLAKAAELEKAGQTEAAEKVIEAPPPEVKPPTIDTPKVKGLRKTWRYMINDKRLFVVACVEGQGQLSLDCLAENSVVLGQLVRAMKDKLNAPGVSVYYEEG